MIMTPIPVTGLVEFIETGMAGAGKCLDFGGDGPQEAATNEDVLERMARNIIRAVSDATPGPVIDVVELTATALRVGMDVGAQYVLARQLRSEEKEEAAQP
mgnify:CR=1